MKDLRDPIDLGSWILSLRAAPNLRGEPLSKVVPKLPASHIRDYNHDPGPIEKYGDPTKLPSTLGTPIE